MAELDEAAVFLDTLLARLGLGISGSDEGWSSQVAMGDSVPRRSPKAVVPRITLSRFTMDKFTE